jgi:hypothetical protein
MSKNITDNCWTYFNPTTIKYFTSLDDFKEESFGFIYKITHIPSQKFYIGKKNLFSERNVKLGVKEIKNLPIQKGRKPTTKKVTKESDWKNYWGSNKDFLEFVKTHPEEEFKREILHVCTSKIDLTYWETHYLFVNKVLFNPLSFNKNISGKFYVGKIGE